MSYDRMRLYDAGRFHDTELPDRYQEAERLSETEHIYFHHALERVLDCEHTLLTGDGMLGGAIEIRFWPSETQGIFVLIETSLAFVEQVVVPNPANWLPFLSRHLAPLIAVSNQSAMIALHGKTGNAFIAWERHGGPTRSRSRHAPDVGWPTNTMRRRHGARLQATAAGEISRLQTATLKPLRTTLACAAIRSTRPVRSGTPKPLTQVSFVALSMTASNAAKSLHAQAK